MNTTSITGIGKNELLSPRPFGLECNAGNLEMYRYDVVNECEQNGPQDV